ncbi:efflux RND transporter periplasmic adaptor subunit [Telmatocola sphagniphila]|uniref:Efflux RND transporter periplasmic adaptor subunit n=1 Tax=Telmatocola sphagniphila TaxID=1123043 RepID=A0A8E6EWV7_9BACT|nr:efflux RND transporter periplasmic adaptor subunit [Telmatocola sphagniphila]QVL34192.1 efflux RND transporter periplasmic adaptor subunit [Telmatocola sphagniphila]
MSANLNPRPRRRISLPFVGLLCLLLGGGGGYFGNRWLSASKTAQEKPDDHKEEEKPSNQVEFKPERWAAAGVTIGTPRLQPFVDFAWRTGRIALNEEQLARVSTPVDGIVREVKVRLGQEVHAGEPLVVIESREVGQLRLELLKMESALAAEHEHADWLTITSTNAESLIKAIRQESTIIDIEKQFLNKPLGDWRQQLLVAYSKRNQARDQLKSVKAGLAGVPEATYRKVEMEAETAEATLKATLEEAKHHAHHSIHQVELKVKEAETALATTRARLMLLGFSTSDLANNDPLTQPHLASLVSIKAPFSGTLIEKKIAQGERVTADSQLLLIADVSRVWLQADVFDSDLNLVKSLTGKTIPFRISEDSPGDLKGTVIDPGQIFDKQSRAVTLTAWTDNPGRIWKPGQFVEVGLPKALDEKPVMLLPKSAIMRHESKVFVFVHVSEEDFQTRSVVLGRVAGKDVEIRSGLKPEDKVVLTGGFTLKSILLKELITGD